MINKNYRRVFIMAREKKQVYEKRGIRKIPSPNDKKPLFDASLIRTIFKGVTAKMIHVYQLKMIKFY